MQDEQTSMWEGVLQRAEFIRNEIEGPFGSIRVPKVRKAVKQMLLDLAFCQTDDLPAQAMRTILDAWDEGLYREENDLDAAYEAALERDD